MTDAELAALLDEVARVVAAALDQVIDWSPTAAVPGQYEIDLIADAAALEVLDAAGVGVLSEESGRHRAEHALTVVMDPVDGSTNASRRIPWYATSLCAVDAEGPRVALVVNQATGTRFAARRGGGATCDGEPITPSSCRSLGSAIVGLSGLPKRHLGWKQFRVLGASALDLCLVANGALDGYLDCSLDAHGSWDYLGALLVCHEAGAAMADLTHRELVALEHADRRTPVAAGTVELFDELRATLLATR